MVDGQKRVGLAPAKSGLQLNNRIATLATAFGVYYLTTGLLQLLAGFGAGWLWQAFGAPYAFGAGAVLSAGALMLATWQSRARFG